MAPSITAVQILPSKQKNKLRKPIVEKMRRDRINSSIEKLKLLLEKEFKAQEANIKLEKADILETAVEYLARHRTVTIGQKSPQQDYREGFSHCLKEALLFLSHHAATPRGPAQTPDSLSRPFSPCQDRAWSSCLSSHLPFLPDANQAGSDGLRLPIMETLVTAQGPRIGHCLGLQRNL
ncbi:transcription factor HES-5-like [Pleurodeles waltl]|uniref:transcription factor HES-5-like n=1 Tax=Pleurodeles waltl TaxID=8319 RepID=UPI00370966DA